MPKGDIVHNDVVFHELDMVNLRLPIDKREGEGREHRPVLVLVGGGWRDNTRHDLPEFTLLVLEAIQRLKVVAEANLRFIC